MQEFLRRALRRPKGRGAGIRKAVLFALALSALLRLAPPVRAAEGAAQAGAPDDAGGIAAEGGNALKSPNALGAGFASVLYDSGNGLPTSEANDIVQSDDGFIWIGSYGGLIRYDGKEFRRYEGVTSVKCLFVDSKQRLWIGTNDHGMFMLRDEVFTPYNRAEGLRSSFVQAVAEDLDGNIFIATTMGLDYIDPSGTLRHIDDQRLNMAYIVDLTLGADGAIYGSTNNDAFFAVRNLQVTAFYRGEDLGFANQVNAIYPDLDRPGFVYLGTHGSEVIYGDIAKGMEGFQTISIAPLQTIHAMRRANDLVWLCAENGIGYLDGGRNFTQIQNLPMTTQIHRMMTDYQGNLWFASTRQGVMKIVKNRFTDLFQAAEIDPAVVNSACIYRGCLYVGTDKGLLILDKDYRKVENSLTERMQGCRIRSIKKDGKGALWLGTTSVQGLVRYDGETGAIANYTEDNGMPSNRSRVMLELSDGNMAVATNAGTMILQDGKPSFLYGNAQGLNNLEILCLEEGADGKLYMGSDGDGIYIADRARSKTVTRLGLDDGLESEVILRIKRDPVDPELFWVITSNSIARLKDGAVVTLKHFPYSNNFDLYFSDGGMVWILSSNGVYVVRRADLLRDPENMDYTLFDTACGLPSVATANSYSYQAENGMLYIAGSKGVSAVNINGGIEDDGEIRMAVPYLMVDDQYLPVRGEEVHIPPDCKRLLIYPFVFTYSLSNPHVTFRLEGFDDAPVTLTRRDLSVVGYTNLDGGTYRFHLSVINSNTGEEAESLVVTIIKDKALHEHFWFWVLCALALMALVSGAVTLYFRRKTKILLKEQEKTKELIREITVVFAKCIDMKDHYTNGHSARVSKYSVMLARQMGKSKEEVDNIRNIALLHDIGKISIPDNILNKPGRLTDEEFAVMRSHSQRGYDILKEIAIAPELAIGAGFHHERLDGKGYPQGLKNEEIPEIARIIAVADTFDAMYSTRPYRKKMRLRDAVAEIQRSSGTQLSPEVVDAFMKLVKKGAFGKLEPPDDSPTPDAENPRRNK
ncbi:MAG: HD domain-containing protein [Oscillibacter sp.]|nr:HD domain-containing protein [Oscillibacter sp.]